MSESVGVYERLREKVDTVGFGFPESMVTEGERPEIAVLKALFSPEDAEVFVAMRAGYQTPEEFAEQADYDPEFAKDKLYDMSKRGLIYRRSTDEGLEYRLIPLAHGIFEFNVNHSGMASWFPPFADYLGKSMFMPAVTATDSPFERAVPAKAEYVSDGILPQDDIVTTVKNMEDSFAITDCLCRKAPASVGAPLSYTLRTCMYTGEWAQYAVENGFAEKASRDDILKIIDESDEAGRCVQVLNSSKPEVICSCDRDACLVLVQHRLGIPGPARALRSNYVAVVDRQLCTDCGDCIPRCPVDALASDADGRLTLKADDCCGCALCIAPCDFDAITLIRKPTTYNPEGGAFDSYDRQSAYRQMDPNTVTMV